MMMALLARHLHRPLDAPTERSIIGRVLDSQPPLLVQEQLLFRIIWIGFIVLTLAVGSGSVASMKLTGKILPFDHKTVFTLLSWLTFGVLLAGRHIWGWRGRVALRWTLTGFGFLILARAEQRTPQPACAGCPGVHGALRALRHPPAALRGRAAERADLVQHGTRKAGAREEVTNAARWGSRAAQVLIWEAAATTA
ncbi:hypothetical protein G6F31_014991 [Rhizopus arrhizus]|nr:hypothetical protein G6F31_014991 [Rhizopus arrhizus]